MKIIKNKSIEQYKKRFRYKNERLLKISKKDIEDFNNKNKIEDKNSLLQGKNWWLIGDTYYEVPKAPRFIWFRNLNAGVQLLTCFAVVGAAGGITYYEVYKNFVKQINVEYEGNGSQYTDIKIEQKLVVGQPAEIKLNLKDSAKKQKFLPDTITKVETGGVTLPRYIKDEVGTNKSINLKTNNNSIEPENYYTYETNENRDEGSLYIKKILGEVKLTFDVSTTKELIIDNLPTNCNYFVGQKFDSTGLKVFAVNATGKTTELKKDEYKLTINDGYTFSSSDKGTNKIYVTYDNTAASFNVDVVEPTKIHISKLPQTIFSAGDTFTLDGLEIDASNQDIGMRLPLDSKSCKIEIDGVERATYTFQESDKGHLKEVCISFGDLLPKKFFIAYPIDCATQNEFKQAYENNYDAISLTANDIIYDIPFNRGNNSNVLISGTGPSSKLRNDEDNTSYCINSKFGNMNVQLDNLSLENVTGTHDNNRGFGWYNNAVFNKVVFNDMMGTFGQCSNTFGTSLFKCVFNSPNNEQDYGSFIYTGSLDYNECTFNCYCRNVKCYHEDTSLYYVSLNNCSFNSTHMPQESGDNVYININDLGINGDVILNINNCTFNYTGEGEYDLFYCKQKDDDNCKTKIFKDGTLLWEKGRLVNSYSL